MSFAETVAAAVRDFAEHGFDNESRLEFWLAQIRAAAEAQATSQRRMEEMLRDALRAVYTKLVENQGVLKLHPSVSRFTLQMVEPRLRAELDRRILASANLIKLNQQQAVDKTLQRFSGWATSIPAGGAADPQMRKTSEEVKKSLKSLPFIERRCLTDQGHKLAATINDVVAVGGGAIAGRWFSHFRRAGYDYREDHKERDGRAYLIRGSWAQTRGLVKVGEAGYTDAITQPCEEVSCQCKYVYIFNLREVPDDMITVLGREELARVRKEIAAA